MADRLKREVKRGGGFRMAYEKNIIKDNHTAGKTPAQEELAERIMHLAGSRLTVDLRFLGKAFEKFELHALDKARWLMATDGKMLYYVPEKLLQVFREKRTMPARTLLHLTLHCILGHPFQKQEKSRDLWDLASDVAVEQIIRQLNISGCILEEDGEQRQYLALLQEYCPHMTAEELYNYFLAREQEEEKTKELAALFQKDSHFLWEDGKKRRAGRKAAKEDPALLRDVKKDSGEEAEETEEILSPQEDEEDETQEKQKRQRKSRLQKEWKDIAKQAQLDLHTFSKRFGQKAGTLMDSLAAVTFEECDYGEFLRRFGARHEVMQISDDEFDMIYYTYGLKKYGNIPLIEPLEFRDDKRIREFVIAIDTSGSVQGDIVQSFLQKTCDVLRQSGSFMERVKIYLVQCDAQIQHVDEIESLDNLPELISGLRLKGFGGTDFRPVFAYVDGLLKSRVLTQLNGLIYFTDGAGIYPEKKPEYKTAFVFHRDDAISPRVPYWAIRAVLTTDNIRILEDIDGYCKCKRTD